ncbi:MAG TPA: tripartite tricarboxylate transporter substrate-binding protein [Microvirga sp.]|jgi:tripartite-type tricarboxylate transporter receptor subunit TctC|nr:tripartite tricarboxylate transporter substrate-binding protein [Microvirga sp.]
MPIAFSARCGLAALALVLAGTAAHAQGAAQYPSKRVNLVVGFAAGGFADTLARTVGQKLQEKWGQPVTVENRAGAGGNTAAKFVTGAAPDGHTILVTTTAIAINETLYKQRDYRLDELTAVAMPASSPESIAVHPSKPAGSLKEFLDWAKDREITFGTAGVGSGSHLAAEYFFKNIAKIKANHVPFRGGALSVQAAVGNQIDVVASSFGSAPQVAEGKLKGLAVAGTERSVSMPQVPTFSEAGFKDFVAESWVGFFVPAKTDPAIVEKLNAAINEIVTEPQGKQHLTGLGYQLATRSVVDSNKYLASEVQNWGTMVKAVGITVE